MVQTTRRENTDETDETETSYSRQKEENGGVLGLCSDFGLSGKVYVVEGGRTDQIPLVVHLMKISTTSL